MALQHDLVVLTTLDCNGGRGSISFDFAEETLRDANTISHLMAGLDAGVVPAP
jgi:hypothetical protein